MYNQNLTQARIVLISRNIISLRHLGEYLTSSKNEPLCSIVIFVYVKFRNVRIIQI